MADEHRAGSGSRREIKWARVLLRTLEFVLVLIVLIDCNSIYRAYTEMPIDLATWALTGANITVLLLIALHLWMDPAKWEIVKSHGALFAVFLVWTFEFSALNAIHHHGKGFFGYFLFFVNGMILLYRFYEKEGELYRLLYLLEHVVLFLAVASLILWIGSSVLELWGRNPDIKVSWGGFYSNSNYLNLCIRRWWYQMDVKKNLGIFIEPPMYGLFLGFGLYTELFLKKKSNPAIVLIFLLTLISNRAILALLLAMGALFFLYLELARGKGFARVLTPAILILSAAGAAGLIYYKSKVGWGSFATHIDDFAASFKCWVKYPILGCGYDNEMPIKELMSDFRAHNQGLSNSAAVVLAEGGIVLFGYYVLPFFLMMAAYFRKNRKLAYWSVGMFLFWVVVIFHLRLFIFFLLALGYAMIDFRITPKDPEKKLRLSLRIPSDSPSQETGYFTKKLLNLPLGFVAIMGMLLLFFAGYGLVCAAQFSARNFIVSLAVLALEGCGFALLRKKGQLSRKSISLLQMGSWLMYLLFGQAYQVMNSFYTLTGLHIQTNWYRFLVLVVVLYACGAAIAEGLGKN